MKVFKISENQGYSYSLESRDKNKIHELHRRLKSGEEWEALAYECFQDSILKNNGGDLGWHKYGELDTRFEIKAFALNPREVSEPIKTKDGYSIIQLIESELHGFLIEDEYQLRKKKLIDLGVIDKNEKFVITGGVPVNIPGTTNYISIL